jgi:hypothetical protein
MVHHNTPGEPGHRRDCLRARSDHLSHDGRFGGPLAALLEDVAHGTSSADPSSRKTVSAWIDRQNRGESTPER